MHKALQHQLRFMTVKKKKKEKKKNGKEDKSHFNINNDHNIEFNMK